MLHQPAVQQPGLQVRLLLPPPRQRPPARWQPRQVAAAVSIESYKITAAQFGRMRDGVPQRGRVRGARHQADRPLVLHQGDRRTGGRGAHLPRGIQHWSAL